MSIIINGVESLPDYDPLTPVADYSAARVLADDDIDAHFEWGGNVYRVDLDAEGDPLVPLEMHPDEGEVARWISISARSVPVEISLTGFSAGASTHSVDVNGAIHTGLNQATQEAILQEIADSIDSLEGSAVTATVAGTGSDALLTVYSTNEDGAVQTVLPDTNVSVTLNPGPYWSLEETAGATVTLENGFIRCLTDPTQAASVGEIRVTSPDEMPELELGIVTDLWCNNIGPDTTSTGNSSRALWVQSGRIGVDGGRGFAPLSEIGTFPYWVNTQTGGRTGGTSMADMGTSAPDPYVLRLPYRTDGAICRAVSFDESIRDEQSYQQSNVFGTATETYLAVRASNNSTTGAEGTDLRFSQLHAYAFGAVQLTSPRQRQELIDAGGFSGGDTAIWPTGEIERWSSLGTFIPQSWYDLQSGEDVYARMDDDTLPESSTDAWTKSIITSPNDFALGGDGRVIETSTEGGRALYLRSAASSAVVCISGFMEYPDAFSGTDTVGNRILATGFRVQGVDTVPRSGQMNVSDGLLYNVSNTLLGGDVFDVPFDAQNNERFFAIFLRNDSTSGEVVAELRVDGRVRHRVTDADFPTDGTGTSQAPLGDYSTAGTFGDKTWDRIEYLRIRS